MRKAKMSFQSGQVKQVIRTYAVEIQTSDKKELEAEAVTLMLRKAMGANCKSGAAIDSRCKELTSFQMTGKDRVTEVEWIDSYMYTAQSGGYGVEVSSAACRK